MTIEASVPRTRRALIAAGLSGLAAALAGALGRPLPVRAAAGQALIMGKTTNSAGTSSTKMTTKSTGYGLYVVQNGSGSGLRGRAASGGNYGVYGSNAGSAGSGGAIRASGVNNYGLVAATAHQNRSAVRATNSAASAGSGGAIQAIGGQNDGVVGSTDNPTRYGMRGSAPERGIYGEATAASETSAAGVIGAVAVPGAVNNSAGVLGIISSDPGTSGPIVGVVGLAGDSSGDSIGVYGTSSNGGASGMGVFGQAGGDGSGIGVKGSSGGGAAVFGIASSGQGVSGTAASSGIGVLGISDSGSGVQGSSTSGYAGYFSGKVLIGQYLDVVEQVAPTNPDADTARLFVRDNGSGKTQLCVIFPTGSVVTLATEA